MSERVDPRITDHGFAWLGQPLTSCEECGKPLWDHEGVAVGRPGEGPFGGFEVVSHEEAARRMPAFGHYAGIRERHAKRRAGETQ